MRLLTHRFFASIYALRCRVVALAILIVTMMLLLTAAGLTPQDAGHGTHTQLGLAPCGFQAATGLPCATCGMTTSSAHTTNGHLFQAFLIQPAGTVLAILTAMAAWVSLWSLVSGMPLATLGKALWQPSVILGLIAIILTAWGYTALRTTITG